MRIKALDWLRKRPAAQEQSPSQADESVEAEAVKRTSVKVGWTFKRREGSVLMFDPEELEMPAPQRMRSAEMSKRHAKSASRCPAIINLESRYFVIRCPYDLRLRFERDDKGVALLRNLDGDRAAVRSKQLSNVVFLVPEHEWRYPDRPTVQIMTPYVFIADEPVYLNQVPPFFHYLSHPWPGTLFGGRFPTDVWPRPLMWAFEWQDTSKELQLNRGDPWFYVQFETTPPNRPVQLVEAEATAELTDYIDSLSGVVNYTNQTFDLFKAAEKRRPEKLLVPLQRKTRPGGP